MFLNLGSKNGGRKIGFLRFDIFGHKNFEPSNDIKEVIIDERRFFHIGYFTGKPSSERKVYISMGEFENLKKLVMGQAERLSKLKQQSLDSGAVQ